MPLPNFFIIGGQKCGTTSLHNYLNQHPQIFMSSIKEPHYFITDKPTVNFKRKKLKQYLIQKDREVKALGKYIDLFSDVTDEIAIGESSTGYLGVDDAPKNIHGMIPDAKIVAILRNPVDRAISHYKYHVMHGIETKSFEVALKKEKQRRKIYKEPLYGYFERGLYYEGLKKYYDLFPENQIKICIFEEFKTSPINVVKDILLFLGVDPNKDIDTSIKYNSVGTPKSVALYNFVANIASIPWMNGVIEKTFGGYQENIRRMFMKPTDSEVTSDSHKTVLMNNYEDDIQKLEKLTGMDLSIWTNK